MCSQQFLQYALLTIVRFLKENDENSHEKLLRKIFSVD